MCYDADRTDAGAMIFPCTCKGDVAAVHERCLKRWLMEVSENTDLSVEVAITGTILRKTFRKKFCLDVM